LRYPALSLLSYAQLGQIGADRIERRSHLIRDGALQLLNPAALVRLGTKRPVYEQGRNAQPVCAPLGGGRSGQGESVIAEDPREIGWHRCTGGDHDL
jgi:hypothetical protein